MALPQAQQQPFSSSSAALDNQYLSASNNQHPERPSEEIGLRPSLKPAQLSDNVFRDEDIPPEEEEVPQELAAYGSTPNDDQVAEEQEEQKTSNNQA